MRISKIVIFFSLFATSLFAVGQAEIQKENKNQLVYKLKNEEIDKVYYQNLQNELEYLNGKEYKPYHNPSHSNPYYNSKIGIGTLYLNGKSYNNLLFIYDIHNDDLIHIAKNINLTQYYIKLKKEEIDSFSISHENSEIILHNIKLERGQEKTIKDGFYEIENFKNMSLYYKHTKVLSRKLGYDEYVYVPKKYLFIRNTFHPIQTKGQFLRLFPEDKKLIKRKMRSISNTYKKLDKAQLILLLEFIESKQSN